MRLLAVRSEQPSVGSAFCPVKSRDEPHEKALCVWLNSSLGILGAIGAQTLKTPSYPRFGLEDQKGFPVPDLTAEEASKLAAAYDTLQHATLLPIKQMGRCQTRAGLDKAVATAAGDRLGFDTERITRIREALCAEPSITGQRVELTR